MIFGIGDSYPWKLQEALLGGESKLSRLHFSMIHDINSPPRHQDDIGATLDDTFFHMNFATFFAEELLFTFSILPYDI